MKKPTYTVSGTVQEGKKYGRKIGFPTANLDVITEIEHGIYAGFVIFSGKKEKKIAAVIVDKNQAVEAHILDFEGNLYGQKIEVEILKKIRAFKTFDTEQELIAQIHKDISNIRKILK